MKTVYIALIVFICLIFGAISCGTSNIQKTQPIKKEVVEVKNTQTVLLESDKKDLEIGRRVHKLFHEISPYSEVDYKYIGKKVYAIIKNVQHKQREAEQQARRARSWITVTLIAILGFSIPYVYCRIKKI